MSVGRRIAGSVPQQGLADDGQALALGAVQFRVFQVEGFERMTTTSATTRRVNHLLSAGMTYQGACRCRVTEMSS